MLRPIAERVRLSRMSEIHMQESILFLDCRYRRPGRCCGENGGMKGGVLVLLVNKVCVGCLVVNVGCERCEICEAVVVLLT